MLRGVDAVLNHRRQDPKRIGEQLAPLPERADVLAKEQGIERLLDERLELTSPLRGLGINVD